MICSSHAYIYVMVHSTCKCYPLFVPLTCNSNMFYYYFIHHFIMCNVFVMCNLSYIDNSMQSITEGTCFLTSSLKYFSFCILLVITWSTFIFFKIIFFCDSPVQLTSVLLCHHNILPVLKYLTFFLPGKKVFYN